MWCFTEWIIIFLGVFSDWWHSVFKASMKQLYNEVGAYKRLYIHTWYNWNSVFLIVTLYPKLNYLVWMKPFLNPFPLFIKSMLITTLQNNFRYQKLEKQSHISHRNVTVLSSTIFIQTVLCCGSSFCSFNQ